MYSHGVTLEQTASIIRRKGTKGISLDESGSSE